MNRHQRRAQRARGEHQTIESKCNACGVVFHRMTLGFSRKPEAKRSVDRALAAHALAAGHEVDYPTVASDSVALAQEKGKP